MTSAPIAFKPFREETAVPNICGSCNKEMTSGVYHKVAGVAEEKFHGFHTACLAQALKEDRAKCPLCQGRVSSVHGVSLVRYQWNLKLISAVENKDIEQVLALIDINNKLLPKEALHLAAKNGSIDILRLLLTSPDWSEDAIEGAVCEAATHNQTEAIRLLLEDRSTAEMNLGPAVCAAAKNGHYKPFTLLLERCKISDEVRGAAARLVSSGLHRDSIIYFLLKDRELSEAIKGQDALSESAKNLPLETIRLLSRRYKAPEALGFRLALFGPIRDSRWVYRHLILREGPPLSVRDKEDLMLCCARHVGDTDVVWELVRNTPFTGSFLRGASSFANAYGQYKIAGILFSYSCIRSRPSTTLALIGSTALGALAGLRNRFKTKL